MRNTYNVEHGYAIHLNLDKFLTPFTKLMLDAKASACSTIRENLLLYRSNFSAYVITLIIQHI